MTSRAKATKDLSSCLKKKSIAKILTEGVSQGGFSLKTQESDYQLDFLRTSCCLSPPPNGKTTVLALNFRKVLFAVLFGNPAILCHIEKSLHVIAAL
jgi:hypothetical protein